MSLLPTKGDLFSEMSSVFLLEECFSVFLGGAIFIWPDLE